MNRLQRVRDADPRITDFVEIGEALQVLGHAQPLAQARRVGQDRDPGRIATPFCGSSGIPAIATRNGGFPDRLIAGQLRPALPRAILSLVDNYSAEVDGVFVALADPTRRAVIRRLGGGPTSVGELARDFPMALPSFMKHVRTLEAKGLIRTRKSGRVRTCVLARERLALVEDWLAEQREIWEGRTVRLEQFVTESQEEEQP